MLLGSQRPIDFTIFPPRLLRPQVFRRPGPRAESYGKLPLASPVRGVVVGFITSKPIWAPCGPLSAIHGLRGTRASRTSRAIFFIPPDVLVSGTNALVLAVITVTRYTN